MRPQLSPQQAAQFTRANVLRYTGTAGADRVDPWEPRALGKNHLRPDYLVGPGQSHKTVQSAIDHALRAGWTRRVVIGVSPGIYPGLVYLPPCPHPVTILGLGRAPSDTILTEDIDAEMPGAEYAARFGYHFATSPGAVTAFYNRIAARDTITTANASVMRVASDDVQLLNLTIRNAYNADRDQPQSRDKNRAGQYTTGQHQAVALHVAGADRFSGQDLRLQSYQDTLYLQSPAKGETVRSCFMSCDIEGDVDFIFGQSTAWFEDCTIRSLGTRAAQSWATAPSTDMRTRFGFVFNECTFAHDSSEVALAGTMRLGRQWFEGVRATPYGTPTVPDYRCTIANTSAYTAPTGTISRATLDSVGKCVILNSLIGPHIARDTPWDDWGGTTWNPRHRPVLYVARDMFAHLGPWLLEQGLTYNDIDANTIFLGEYGNHDTA